MKLEMSESTRDMVVEFLILIVVVVTIVAALLAFPYLSSKGVSEDAFIVALFVYSLAATIMAGLVIIYREERRAERICPIFTEMFREIRSAWRRKVRGRL